VIVNLAVFFAWRVFWPQATYAAPFGGGFDVVSVLIAVVASAALLARKLDVIPVIALSGLAGFALWAAGIQAAT
jgi:chromate transporter